MNQIDYAILAKPFSSMYRMHKYWSRKPFNVVSEYIKAYTDKGDIILDPFCGSGVTAIEAIKLGRKVIAADLNPMAIFITRMTLEPINLTKFKWAFEDIKNEVYENINKLYETACHKCDQIDIIHHTEWECKDPSTQTPIRIVYSCNCSSGLLIKDVEKQDLRKIKDIEDQEIPFWYPRDVKLPSFRKEKWKYIHQLFTHRNLISLSILFNAINKIKNPKIKEMMNFVFTSSLAQASKMKMITKGKPTATSKGWIAPRYYVPRRNQETNVWRNFENHFNRVFKGKKESNQVLQHYHRAENFDDFFNGEANALILEKSAFDLSEISNGKIDYIFTDPPYGGNIPFFGLSAFWGAWLKYKFDWDKEITINSHQGKSSQTYHQMLSHSFKKMYKLLKPERYLTVSFHSTQREPWESALRIIVEEKFELEKIIYQPLPKSFSQTVRGIGRATIGDYYIRFLKPINQKYKSINKINETNYEEKIISRAIEIIKQRGEPTSLLNILIGIYESLNSAEILYSKKESIENTLKNHIGKEFILKEVTPERQKYWWLNNTANINQTPLSKRITKEIRDILTYEKDISRFDLLQGLLRKLRGPLTPHLDDINRLLIRYVKKEDEERPQWKKAIAMLEKKIPLERKQHTEFVYLLAKCGSENDFNVWINKKEQKEMCGGEKLYDLCSIKELKSFAASQKEGEAIENFDILWLKRGKIICQFEVETNENVSDATIKASNHIRDKKAGKFQQTFVIPRRLQEVFSRKSFGEKVGNWGLILYDELIDYLGKYSQVDKEILARASQKYGKVPDQKEQEISHIKATVKSCEKIKGNRYKIILSIPEIKKVEPGQFLHILCDRDPRRNMWFTSEEVVAPGSLPRINGIEIKEKRPLLRRPMSIHRIYYKGFDRKELAQKDPLPKGFRKLIHRPHNLIDILFKKVGTGTEFLSNVKRGEKLDILGPIGKGYFRISKDRNKAVLIAGGMGVAPLMALAERLRYEDKEVIALIGAIDKDKIPLEAITDSTVEFSFADMEVDYFVKEFREIGINAIVATEDGSLGEKGLVTDVLNRLLKNGKIDPNEIVAYSCGSEPMLKEVVRIAHSYGFPCQVLLEQRMGCGTGKCLSCAIRIRDRVKRTTDFKLVCTDGPVFNAEEVLL